MMKNLQEARRRYGNPMIKKPVEQRESPDTEQLIHEAHDTRPKMVKPFETVLRPELNRLYGTLRVVDGWQHCVDNYASGYITTIAGAQALQVATLAQALPDIRLMRWPGAVSMYLVIRSFSAAAQVGTLATPGSLEFYYQDTVGGITVPLGNTLSNTPINNGEMHLLIPTPITDNGLKSVGTVIATLNAGATTATYAWQLAYSYAYLLPTNKPYDVQLQSELLDGQPGRIDNIFPS